MKSAEIFSGKQSFRYNRVIHVLIIVVIGFIAYSNSFHVPFQLDDRPNITENILIKDTDYLFAPSGYCSNLFPPADRQFMCHFFKTRYIGYLTFAMNYYLNGTHVTGYHIVNFAIHTINALLVYLLVILTFRTPFLSASGLKDRAALIGLFSGLLFIAHPVQTQAVTYIVQRFASLETMFYLLSLVLYIKARLRTSEKVGAEAGIQTGGRARRYSFNPAVVFYILSLISAVLAMKTKEISFTLPVIMVIYEFFFFTGNRGKRILHLIPFLLTMLIIP
jgi:hypothetical protein